MNISVLHRLFQVACAMCFIGHGVFGLITKPIWCNYFAIFGIGQTMAYKLMPVVGTVDVLLGVVLLFYPLRFSAAWLVFWGLFTASLRPLSGEPFAEFLERAGNFGAPIVLLLLTASSINRSTWFDRLRPVNKLDSVNVDRVQKCLQVFGFLLLLGHGWLNIIGKQALLNQYGALGFDDTVHVAQIVGIIECLGAVSILVRPNATIILILLIWKMVSETLYPTYELLEWIERGGSYAVLLGLWVIVNRDKSIKLLTFMSKAPKSQLT